MTTTRRYDKQRGTRSERGYDNRWIRARKAYLAKHPLCAYCLRMGRTTAALIVDHIKPHRGNMVIFWDSGNWQALCKEHHDATKQVEEARGVMIGCDQHGLPIDPNHQWNQ